MTLAAAAVDVRRGGGVGDGGGGGGEKSERRQRRRERELNTHAAAAQVDDVVDALLDPRGERVQATQRRDTGRFFNCQRVSGSKVGWNHEGQRPKTKKPGLCRRPMPPPTRESSRESALGCCCVGVGGIG